jgi:general secretion pathway protein G
MIRRRFWSRRARRGAAGFTLIELLVVLVILGLLAAFVAPQVLNYLGRAKTDAASVQVQNIASILDLYRLDTGRYPERLEDLVEQPPDAPNWNGPYIQRRDGLIDPWGRPYEYRFPGQHGAYDLFTLGADGTPGGEGENRDVTSW